MKIAVCEDHKNERENLKNILETELAHRKISGEIAVFESGEAILDAMRDEVFPINFLDIYMSGITGVEVARKIRARNQEAAIVFTTSSPDHMAEGYDLGAVHYLLKPYAREAVTAALDRCIRNLGTAEQFVTLTSNRESRKVLLSEIWWAEAQNQSCVIRLANESLRVYMSLSELLAKLDDSRFFHCYRSFIVNMDYATHVKDNDFVMRDGSLVPIRREDRTRIKGHFEDYCFNKQRGRD